MEVKNILKKRLRFRDEDDLSLLREVAGQNPFENPYLWKSIQENIFILTGKNFIIKTLKDHLDVLVKLWLEKTNILKDKSGIEEDYMEKDQLCQNIYEYMIQFRNTETKAKKKKQPKENLGKIDRDKWAHMISPEDTNVQILQLEDTLSNSAENNGRDANEMNFEISDATSDANKPILATPSRQGQETSKVLRPTRTRKRKINTQRQGLSYLKKNFILTNLSERKTLKF